MVRKLFVGGLPYRTTGDELKDAFAKAGEVASASIVTDRETGRSRGFGFVEMADDAGADAAIEMWNGKEFDGRTLTSLTLARRLNKALRQVTKKSPSGDFLLAWRKQKS